MKRRVFNFAAGVSLVLCLATCVLWVRSYRRLDDVRLFPNPQRYWLVRSADGRLHAQQTWASGPYWQGRSSEYSSGELGRAVYSNLPFRWRIAGFGYGHLTVPSGTGPTLNAHVYLMPHAFPAMVFAVAPVLWLRAALSRRRTRAAGLCARCGYDLRASPDRCPECGAATAKPTLALPAAGADRGGFVCRPAPPGLGGEV